MPATNHFFGQNGTAPSVRLDLVARVLVRLFVIAVVAQCGSFGAEPAYGQYFLVLGQSPGGPLLDEGDAASWLDDVADTAAAEELPESVVGGRFGQQAPDPDPRQEIPAAIQDYGSYNEMLQCPSCGSSLSVGCPTCSPMVGAGNGALTDRLAGLATSGPIAECRDLLQPVTRESWLFRPFSAGWFMGFMQGNELVDNWVGQEQGFFGGYRLGWDFDPYWGCETRFGFASVALYDSDRARAAQQAADLAAGISTSDAWYYRFDTRRDSGIRLWDVEMLWYPFGDTYIRPYFLLGLGTARVDFMDRLYDRRIKSVLAMPIAIGFKYRVQDWLAVRVEATDNFIAGSGSGFSNLHNFSLTAGLEVRFGGTRTAYWPYYPGRHYW